MNIQVVIQSIIVGALAGAAISAGAARMFKAPEIQGMGAFRTLGELNACNGDSVSHFTFGLGFFISSAAAAIGTGALTQDVLHRVIPNWTAAAINATGKDYKNSVSLNLVFGAVIGAVVFVFLNTASSLVPADLAKMSGSILGTASTNMINIVMPLIFLWAAIDAGKTVGMWSIIFAGAMQIISGNSLPGIIFGILVGTLAQEKGYTKVTKTMLVIIIVMICLIAYFRGFHTKLLGMF